MNMMHKEIIYKFCRSFVEMVGLCLVILIALVITIIPFVCVEIFVTNKGLEMVFGFISVIFLLAFIMASLQISTYFITKA